MTEKNRDFAQVRVGTVVGFDSAPWNAEERITITQKVLDGWQFLKAKPHFSSRLFSRNLWDKYGGYIISQPEDARESEEYSKDDLVNGLMAGENRDTSEQTVATFSGTFSKEELLSALRKRTDTERLDWLSEISTFDVFCHANEWWTLNIPQIGDLQMSFSGDSLREVIDAAMDQEATQ